MDSTNQNKNETFFLSYVREDISIIELLYNKLKSKNLNVWFDKTSLLGGEEWSDKIEEAIKYSKAIIICISKNSINKEGFYQREINYALECAKEKPKGVIYIIPLLLEDCNIPSHLRKFHCINYFENNGFNNLIKTLFSLTGNERDFNGENTPKNNEYEVIRKYRYDDGNAPWADTLGSEMAVMLSPINYPTILEKVRVYITSDDAPNTPFKINIYSSNNCHPVKRLNSIDIIDHDGEGNKWHEIDISEHKIIISEGNFFVSMEWLKIPGKDGMKNEVQYVYAKKNTKIPGRTFFKFGNQDKWWRINDLTALIHAVDSLGNKIEP